MNQAARGDLTTGGILSKILKVAAPVMGTQLIQMAYNIANMFWLGHLGDANRSSEAIAASGTAGLYIWLGMGVMLLSSVGAGIGVSQALGRREEDEAQSYAGNALQLSAALGLLFAALLVLMRRPLVAFFAYENQSIVRLTERYLLIIACGQPMAFVSNAITSVFNAAGKARTPFVINASGLALNALLDPLMIYVWGLGVPGVALATVIAQTAVLAALSFALLRGSGRPLARVTLPVRPNASVLARIVRWSAMPCLESVCFTLLALPVSRLVVTFGEKAMSVNRIGSQVESLTWLVGGGFGTAFTAYVGQNCGAQKWDRIERGVALSSLAMGLYGLAVTALLHFRGAFLCSLLLPDAALEPMFASYMRVLALCQLPQCLEVVAAGAFKGSGRTIRPSAVSIATNLLRVPAAYLLAATSLGLTGVWVAISATAGLRGAISYGWYLAVDRRRRMGEAAPSCAPAAADG
ncbi:MAG: MATE family efflux transporter [Clostridiales bacterium]|nr:MATE family efflux transporter [Clostridiales bacterium]